MAIVRSIRTNDLLRYHGNGEFENIRTGWRGYLDKDPEKAKELAQQILRINLPATALLNEYPILEEMIRTLNLKIQP